MVPEEVPGVLESGDDAVAMVTCSLTHLEDRVNLC